MSASISSTDIPDCLKHGTAAGIGLFIAFVGFRNANIIVANPATFVALGKISDPQVLLAALGVLLIAILMARRVGGAILIGIVAIALAGIPLGVSHWPAHIFSWPHPAGTFLKLDFRSAMKLGLGELIFVFFFVDLFDNVGTLVGVCEARRIPARRQIPAREPRAAGRCFRHDGRRADRHVHGDELHRKRRGSRRGRANGARQRGDCGTFCRGDVLRAAGGGHSVLCHGAGADSGWRADVRFAGENQLGRFHRCVPAFITLIATPLTFSIATGLSLGLLSFTFLKLFTGRHKEISPLIWVLSVLFLLRYIFLGAG